MQNAAEVIARLKSIGDPDNVAFKAKKFGIHADQALGVFLKDLNAVAKELGKNNALALELFETGYQEARILCSKIYRPQDITSELMEYWVSTFDNWEICDSFSMRFFASSPFAMEKLLDWTQREAEFEKRAGFVIMAAYSSAHKKAANEVFEDFFPIIKREAHDPRIYVKKAVNWALRSIGKRNIDLHQASILVGRDLLSRPEASAQWIAKDALRELEGPKPNILGYPRAIYRR